MTSLSNAHRLAQKPLAGALALALGFAGITVASATFAATGDVSPRARVNSFLHNFDPQKIKQYRQQHPHPLFKNFHRHQLTQAHAPTIAAAAVTSCVDNASSATTPGTLRYAVINAAEGDTIDLSAVGCSSVTLTQGALPVTVNNLTIGGPSSGTFTIDGNATDRVFYASGNGTLALNHLTVRNGHYAGSPATGGCILSEQGAVYLGYSVVSGCSVTATAAASGPSAAGGGGIAAYIVTMYSSTVTGNSASAPAGYALGGGVFSYGYYNQQTNRARGTHQPKRIATNAPVGGPGTIYGSTISNNTVSGYAAIGGGLSSKYGLTVSFSTISGNTASVAPGSSGNTKYFAAGGGTFSLYGTQLFSSTVTGNKAECSVGYCFGGGMSGAKYGGYLGLAYSTVDTNRSDFFGGGTFSKYGAGLYQATVSGNSALGGGGVALYSQKASSSSVFYSSTISFNTAIYGGGVYFLGGQPSLMSSTLVARNVAQAGLDVYSYGTGTPVTVTGANNLAMITTNVTMPPGTLTGDPLLLPLANFGGLTRVQALSAGSPAINAGANPLNFTFDQRGPVFPRVISTAADIGAVEGPQAVTLAPAPALTTWGLTLLGGLLAMFGWRRRRQFARRE